MSRLISRDPFARQELHRVVVPVISRGCDWCGGVSKAKGAFRLFRYDVQTDGGRTYEGSKLFCCKSCHDSYARDF